MSITASLVGLLASLLGVALTLWLIRRQRSTSQSLLFGWPIPGGSKDESPAFHRLSSAGHQWLLLVLVLVILTFAGFLVKALNA